MRSRDDKLSDGEWVAKMVRKYARSRRRYHELAELLQEILGHAASSLAPNAIVEARAKTVASYAEKLWGKIPKYRKRDAGGNLLHPVMDLCGARAITVTHDHRDAICRFIEQHFEVDEENSVDKAKALRTREFGYLSVHYIVKLRQDMFPTREVPVRIGKESFKRVGGLYAEIQVRTLLEHAWAAVEHGIAYKGSFEIPEKWERELARLAAILEDVDEAFARVGHGLATYAASYGAYMDEQELREKMRQLENIRRAVPKSVQKLDTAQQKEMVGVAHRIAKLAICLGDWGKAVRTLDKKEYIGAGLSPLLRDLGVAMCKHYKKGSANYRRGQRYLEKAVELDPYDTDAIASLGGTWKGIDEERARLQYQRAFEVDPSDPYPLGNYLEYETSRQKSLVPVSLALPSIRNAIKRCRDQADVQMNLPWAFYDMGKFHLLLKQPHESLHMYAKAVSDSSSSEMIRVSLDSVERFKVIAHEVPKFEWARRFLRISLMSRLPSQQWTRSMKALKSKEFQRLSSPVVVVVGEVDNSLGNRLTVYRDFLLKAFSGFKGTVIATCPANGAGAIVGDMGTAYRRGLQTIAYVPCMIPPRARVDLDRRRYRQTRCSDGQGFSILECLQAWADIILSGIKPSEVKVLGIGGDEMTAVEYRVALALEATVGVVEDSGGAVTELLGDRDWKDNARLVPLPSDAMTIRALVRAAPNGLRPEVRETVARAIHEAYVRSLPQTEQPSTAAWNELPDDLKDSNRQQADHMLSELKEAGYSVRESTKKRVSPLSLPEDKVEVIAEMEHGRWCVERLLSGWRYGEKKDVSGKISPYIVPWSELPDEAKKQDRKAVRAFPSILAMVGLEIRRRA